ncbi:hypothetical protein LTR15_005901 [Elasticomyces elasticus]|nr:hypothetical protein LTR15_005901 [Elasticomyces elasticus]
MPEQQGHGGTHDKHIVDSSAGKHIVATTSDTPKTVARKSTKKGGKPRRARSGGGPNGKQVAVLETLSQNTNSPTVATSESRETAKTGTGTTKNKSGKMHKEPARTTKGPSNISCTVSAACIPASLPTNCTSAPSNTNDTVEVDIASNGAGDEQNNTSAGSVDNPYDAASTAGIGMHSLTVSRQDQPSDVESQQFRTRTRQEMYLVLTQGLPLKIILFFYLISGAGPLVAMPIPLDLVCEVVNCIMLFAVLPTYGWYDRRFDADP